MALVFASPGSILASGKAGSGGLFALLSSVFLWVDFVQIQIYLPDTSRSSNEQNSNFLAVLTKVPELNPIGLSWVMCPL